MVIENENDKGYTVLGLAEMAVFLEVGKRTPYAWRARDLLPRPDHESVNGSPAWDRATLVGWAARTGRLPVGLAEEGLAVCNNETLPYRRGGRRAKAMVAWEREQRMANGND